MRQFVPGCPRCAEDWILQTGGQFPPVTDSSAWLAYQAEMERIAEIPHRHPSQEAECG